MVGSDDFSRYDASPQVPGRRVDREHGERAAGDPWTTMSDKARDRVAPADQGLMRAADVVSIFQTGRGLRGNAVIAGNAAREPGGISLSPRSLS